jgi:hypothetical protein
MTGSASADREVRAGGENHGPFGRKRIFIGTDRGSPPTDLATVYRRMRKPLAFALLV